MGSRVFNVASYLGKQPLFVGMSSGDLARIAAACQIKHVARGETLFVVGQASEGLYLVVDGQVKLYAKSANGHEKVIEVVEANGCVADAPMFSDDRHSTNASVLSDSLLLMVPRGMLVSEIEHNPGLALRMLGGLSRRLNKLVHEIEAVTLHSGVKRVVDYLLGSPAAIAANPTQHDVTVSLPASKGTIASLLSVTPEHFSRILHDLQLRGLISVQRRHIHILDTQGLASYA
ncbi:MAG: Crp/Fnr family transcriptional regulator [Aquabacterium sp.]|nr:Crp/Fnr family transcriptional regulator [Aquabacterium sp.]